MSQIWPLSRTLFIIFLSKILKKTSSGSLKKVNLQRSRYAKLKLNFEKDKHEKRSKYRFKPPKCRVWGTPEKAEKMFQALFFKNLVLPILAKNFPNWRFWPKMPKNGGFSHISQNPFITFWSLDEVVGDLRIHVCPSFHMSRSFSKTVHYFF